MRKVFFSVMIFLLLFSLGCENVRRKFIRRRKESSQREEMVVTPIDYSQDRLPADIAYMNYYNYWKSWHTELIKFLYEGSNSKKVRACFEQIILNLGRMKELLNEEKSQALEEYIAEVLSLQSDFEHSVFIGPSVYRLRSSSERILSGINRDFAYGKVKGDLLWR